MITCIILFCVMNRATAQPSAGRGRPEPNNNTAYTSRLGTMTIQQYCEKLQGIFDTVDVYKDGMINDFKAAYKAKPRTFGIIAKYRKLLQDYCQVNLVYLYKLPPVGDAKEFRSSLSQVVADNWELTVIFQEFENQQPGNAENVVGEIFERAVAKNDKTQADEVAFIANMNLYKIKYGLPIK